MSLMKIEDFTAKLKDVAGVFPKEQETALKRGAAKMRKAIRSATPDSGVEHKRKLKKSWKIRMNGLTRESIQAEIYSSSSHFHLIERGHVLKTRTGRVIGYVQGRFFMKKTVDAQKDKISEEMVTALYKMVKGRLDG